LRHWHQLDRNVENAARGLVCPFGIRPPGLNLSDFKEANRGDALLKSTGVASEKLSAFLRLKNLGLIIAARTTPSSISRMMPSNVFRTCARPIEVNSIVPCWRMARKNFLIVSLKAGI
jgi:hypothetical protein